MASNPGDGLWLLMTPKRTTASGDRGFVSWGIGLGVFLGFLIAFALQLFVPVLAKLPGLVLCSGDDFEIILRRGTGAHGSSYGVCGGDAQRQVGYPTILLVSTLVWSVVCAPLGIGFARWVEGKAATAGRLIGR